MPKFFSRVDFETMKVLRKRGSSINDVAKAVGRSPAAVSRNLKYKSYEDYLAAMYSRKSKFQKKVEAESGPVRVVTPAAKACSCCGVVKNISEFTPDKSAPDGHKGQCRKCVNAKVRARRHAQKAATAAEAPHVEIAKEEPRKEDSPDLVTWKFIAEELKKMSTPEKVEEEQPNEQGLEPRVGEILNVFVGGKVRRAEIVGSREITEFGYHEKRYLVRYKTFFGYKYADVSEAVLYTD